MAKNCEMSKQQRSNLFTTNVYWVMLKKSFENEKWQQWQNIRMEKINFCKQKQIRQNNTVKAQKNTF